MAKVRNYKKEYDEYHGKQDQIDNRNQRNKARRKLINDGTISKGSSEEVDHKQGSKAGSKLNNSRSNLRAISKTANRSKKK